MNKQGHITGNAAVVSKEIKALSSVEYEWIGEF